MILEEDQANTPGSNCIDAVDADQETYNYGTFSTNFLKVIAKPREGIAHAGKVTKCAAKMFHNARRIFAKGQARLCLADGLK